MKRTLITAIAAFAVLGAPLVAHADGDASPELQPRATRSVSNPSTDGAAQQRRNEQRGLRAERALPDAFAPSLNAQ